MKYLQPTKNPPKEEEQIKSIQEIREKAINDFLEKVVAKGIIGLVQYDAMCKIAEQLKAGGENEKMLL